MQQQYSTRFDKDQIIYYLLYFFCFVVFCGSLFFPLMDKDAAHHANIALHMYEHNDYASLIDRQKAYLDKPHFLFWTSLVSFKIFGINTFAHRFPHLLFALIAIYATYKLAKYLGGKSVGRLAALSLATAQAFVLAITDARMETPLTAGIIVAIWQLVLYVERGKFSHLFFAALATAIAFDTKGWLGPVVIFITIFFYLLTHKKWSVVASFKTWLFIPLFLFFISPVLYAYYLQFDLHPETVVRGRDHISGVKFILWDQLFERSKGFDVKGRNSGYFFLYHTFLWAFFPWSIIACGAIFFWLKRIFYLKKWRNNFSFVAVSFAFVLFAISFSKFKMPHYIIMLLPLAALFTAPYVRIAFQYVKTIKFFLPVQSVFAWLVLPTVIVLNFYFFKPASLFVWFIGLLLLATYLYVLLKKYQNKAIKTIAVTIALSLVFNFFLNYNFFPNLLKYQGGNEMVKMMQEQKIQIPDDKVVLVETGAHSFDFYRKHNHALIELDEFEKGYQPDSTKFYLVNNDVRRQLTGHGFTVKQEISMIDYNVATVQLKFLIPAKRNKQLDTLSLAKISKP